MVYTKHECWNSPSALMTDMINQSLTLFPTAHAQIESQEHQHGDPGSHSNQRQWYKIGILFTVPNIEWGHTNVSKGVSLIKGHSQCQLPERRRGRRTKNTTQQACLHIPVSLFPCTGSQGSSFPGSLAVGFVNGKWWQKTGGRCLSLWASRPASPWLCLSLHEPGSSQAASAGTLTPDSWLSVVHSGDLASSLCPYSLMGETVASCCPFTIPCSASHLFQQLGKQFPVLNDLGLKHLTGPNWNRK